ncbi:MAG: VOC family protein [Lachnospiraceae bacterium]|nr:VOC family protein [Lachnospiraceae bacterium]
MKPMIDHIHITVTDLARAEVFYDKLLPLLGFDLSLKEYDEVPKHEYRIVEYHHAMLSIGLVNQRSAYENEKPSRRKGGALHHIAFRADSPEKVESLYKIIRDLPAEIIHEPRYYPDYCKDYYAFFFKDSEGTEIEIVCFDRRSYY